MDIDKVAQAWLEATARKNWWRVARYMDLSDLIQEGLECWWYTVRRYKHVKDRKHMMSLFKLVFTSRITDHANRRTKKHSDDLLIDMFTEKDRAVQSEDDLWGKVVHDHDDLATFGVMVAQAPEPIKRVLALINTEDGRSRLRSLPRPRRGRAENENERFARLTGLSATINFRQMFIDYFGWKPQEVT